MELIRVASQSKTASVAGAIAGFLRDEGAVEVQAIGAQAVNQATKAVTIARKFLQDDNLDLLMVPTIIDVSINGFTRTAIRFSVYEKSTYGDGSAVTTAISVE